MLRRFAVLTCRTYPPFSADRLTNRMREMVRRNSLALSQNCRAPNQKWWSLGHLDPLLNSSVTVVPLCTTLRLEVCGNHSPLSLSLSLTHSLSSLWPLLRRLKARPYFSFVSDVSHLCLVFSSAAGKRNVSSDCVRSRLFHSETPAVLVAAM